MRLRRHLPDGGMLGRDREPARSRSRGRRRSPAGSAPRDRPASPCRSLRVRRSARHDAAVPRASRRERPFGLLVAEQAPGSRADGARRELGPARAPASASAIACGQLGWRPRPNSRSATERQMSPATRSGSRAASMTTQRLGLVVGDGQERVAQALVERPPLPFEAVGVLALGAAPFRGPRQADLGRQVEDEGQVGTGAVERGPFERAHQRRVDARRGRPGRRASNPRSGRTGRRRPAPAPGGSSRAGDRCAPPRTGAPPRTARTAGPRRRAPFRGCARPSASRRARGWRSPRRPPPSRRSASRAICVDLPAPSPPSKVMKRPLTLEHDAEKWSPLFGRTSCSTP